MTQRAFVLAVLLVAFMPLAALAASMEKKDDVRQNVMGSSSLIQDSKDRGMLRSHKDIVPFKGQGKFFDPNKKMLTPEQLRDLYNGVKALTDALANELKSPGAVASAWGGLSGNARQYLQDVGLTQDNWKYLIRTVQVLPRRVSVHAVDEDRGGENGGVTYKTVSRPFVESYQTTEPVWGPLGCGCRGSAVVGYQTVTRSQTVYRDVQVPDTLATPVKKSIAVLTPYDGSKQVPRLVTETYYVSEPVWAPLGCGCRGSYVVGYTQSPLSRQVTVYDTVAFVGYEAHASQKFTGAGNPNKDSLDQKYLADSDERSLSADGTMATRQLNESGAPVNPTLYAGGKGSDIASSGKAGADARGGAAINNR